MAAHPPKDRDSNSLTAQMKQHLDTATAVTNIRNPQT